MRGLALDYAGRQRPGAPRDTGPLQVAACVVRDEAGRVLLSRRRPDQMSGGFWEVPGGKIEPGETPIQAAARELREETGLDALELRPVLRHTHRFPMRCLDLHFFEASRWQGTPTGREGQRLDWVSPGAPRVGPILESNLRILRRLALPPLVRCAAPPTGDPAVWARETARHAQAEGAGAVLLQARGLAPAQQLALARRLGAALAQVGVALWIDAAPGIAGRSGAVLALSRPEEPAALAPGMLRATQTDDPAASVDADLIFVPFVPGTALPNPGGAALYAMTDPSHAEEALKAGASGLCLKTGGPRK